MQRVDRSLAYSQNFITNPKLIRKILSKSNITRDDLVLEIGAGFGSITKELAATCKEVIAIELDAFLFQKLTHNISECKNITTINTDFLNFCLPQIPYKVFSNIPFNFTSRIMRKLFFYSNPPSLAYFVIQKEAIHKYMGFPRETQISLLIKPFVEMKIIHTFNKEDFNPCPKVIAVLVEIKTLQYPILSRDSYLNYRDFIVYGTTQGKTTLKKNFKKIFTHEQFKRLAQNLDFNLTAYPLDLAFQQWLELFNFYNLQVIDDKRRLVNGSYLRQHKLQNKLKKVYKTRR